MLLPVPLLLTSRASPPHFPCLSSTWPQVSSQAWFESLRYYPKGEEAIINDDCEATYSGNTHGGRVPAEHIQNDVRNRVGIAAADPGWMPGQLPEPWAPEMEARLARLRVTKSSREPSPTK